MRSVGPLLLALLVSVAAACSSSSGGTPRAVEVTRLASSTPEAPPVVLPTPPGVTPVGAGTPDEEALRQLRGRPLWLPSMPTGATCPADESRPWSTPIVGQLHGEGPLYILGSGVDGGRRAVWRYGERGAIKVIWQQAPGVEGPALVRGRRLDGAEALRFDEGADEMVFPRGGTARGPGAEASWKDRPSLVLATTPGCYAFQIDGPDFTSMIVFEARYDPTPR